MIDMPKPYPEEFRRDVVAVARKREAPLEQIAKDFGISETCLKNRCARPTSRTAPEPVMAGTWSRHSHDTDCASKTQARTPPIPGHR
ncbi:hypothetical protein CJ177_34040 [Rhodococcus sp. ACPA1]|nr:hypothetical protein CJ177_34040 [Rhodococcus sp. ACPA1]